MWHMSLSIFPPLDVQLFLKASPPHTINNNDDKDFGSRDVTADGCQQMMIIMVKKQLQTKQKEMSHTLHGKTCVLSHSNTGGKDWHDEPSLLR